MILVKMYFGFICLLALYPVIDLHVKFCRSTVLIKQQKPPPDAGHNLQQSKASRL
jgi:hypothetical protein